MLASIARNTISVERQKTIGATLTIADGERTIDTFAPPVIPCTVLIQLNDSDTGSVLVTGTDSAGANQTETITLSSSKLGQGLKVFKTVTEIAITDCTNGNVVQVLYRGRDGSQVKAQAILFSCIQCQISYTQQSWRNDRSGTVESGKVKFMIPLLCNSTDQKLRAGDLITDRESGNQFLVVGNAFIDGVGLNRFQVVYGERRERT